MKTYRRIARFFGLSEEERGQETREEIEAHIAMRVDELVARGLSEEEARRQAEQRFGDLDEARRRIDDETRRRDRRLGRLERLDALRRDWVLGLRRVRRYPGHAALTVSIFGLGIALTTVMFTFVDSVLLRPLPFHEPDRLVALYSVPEDRRAFPWVSMGNWYDWDRENRSLESSAIHTQEPWDVTVSSPDGAFTVPGVAVYGAFFETLRPRMIAGRAPTADDGVGDLPLAVVSERFWRNELGSRPPSAQFTIELDGTSRTVVGVVARGHEHPEHVDLWIPRSSRPQVGGARNNINFLALARLAESSTLEQAEADLSAIAEGIRATDPEAIYSYGVGVRPLDEAIVGEADDYLGMLMGAVLLVLLIASANLAALGFARGTERSDEIAVRLSLGASRGRVVRHLVTEELLLALAGGLVGLALAWWGSGVLLERVAEVLPRSRDVAFDGRVAAFGIGMSLIAGLAAGLPPALRAAGSGAGRLVTTTRGIRGRGGLPGAVLVAGEVALTVLLLTGAGLMLMSFGAVASRDLGFDPRGVVTLDVTLTAPRYRDDPDATIRYWEAALETLAQLPEAEAVGAGVWIPTGGGGAGFIELDGLAPGEEGAAYRIIGGEYFRALSTPLFQGRAFDDSDRLDSEPVTVINQAMADAFWPEADPIGERVRAVSMESYWFGGEAPWRTIVGVVGDIRHHGFEADIRPEMYVPFRQMPYMATQMSSLVRVPTPRTGAAIASVRDAAGRLDPDLAIEVSTLAGRLDGQLSERRMIVTLLGAFGVTALLLSSLGVYGVLSHAAAARTRELAIRSALGARRTGLVALVLGGAFRLIAVGGVIGITLAIGLRGVLDSLLVDIDSGDPRAYAVAGVCLALVATAAAIIPATRAARLDPLEALRDG
ncbi:MAG: ABC transporter permease [Gemmatimonadetes bacterium]|nr:ABC transporter permease [Gemmatimonadota bacterium]